MIQPSTSAANSRERTPLVVGPPTLERRIGLRSAVLFNLLEMIGVGPFITLPLVIAAAGYGRSVWAWVLGAVIAMADGLVWAELGAAFPLAGGSYAFLREIYGPKGPGNWLSFLYVWQLSFTAPLSIASGCIGLSGFLSVFWPGLQSAPIAALPGLHLANFAAAAACLLVTALLYRNISSVARMAWVLFAGVMLQLPESSFRDSLTPQPPAAGTRLLRLHCLTPLLWAASRRPRCLPPIVTGVTTTSASSVARSAVLSAPSREPSSSPWSSFPHFMSS